MSLYKSLYPLALLAAACTASAVNAATVVLDFEDVDGTDVKLQNGYGGANWNNGFLTYDSAKAPFSARSGTTVAYFNYVDGGMTPGKYYEQAITFDSDVIFQGAWFAGDLFDVRFAFYKDGVLLGLSERLAMSATSTFLAGYAGAVDEVRVLGYAGNFVMDDFTYDTEVPAVPEPASWAMMIVGIGFVGASMRRRKVSIAFA